MTARRAFAVFLMSIVLLMVACGPAPRGDDPPPRDAAANAALDAPPPDAPPSDAPRVDQASTPDASALPEASAPDAPPTPACEGDCGAHGHAHGDSCHCDEGYVDRMMCCVPAPPCRAPDDLLEENDDPASATVLSGGSATLEDLRICPSDRDVFRVPMTVGQQVTVRATFTHMDGDIDLYLFAPATRDLGHARPLAGSDGTRNNERFTYTAAATGEHLLLVTGHNGSENTYGLTVEVTGP